MGVRRASAERAVVLSVIAGIVGQRLDFGTLGCVASLLAVLVLTTRWIHFRFGWTEPNESQHSRRRSTCLARGDSARAPGTR
jgi:hypothetical protein